MNSQSFSLQPFLASNLPPNLQLTGEIARQTNTLALRYQLQGDLSEIKIPAPANSPARQHRLWEKTCFEFFLGIQNAPNYWEFNLSPAGHWNVYRFDCYRQGMHEETAFTVFPFAVEPRSQALSLTLELNLDTIVSSNQPLEVAITAVIERKSGEISYWALTHPGEKADFHRRDSFIIDI